MQKSLGGGGKTLSYLLVAVFAFGSLDAAVVDMGGATDETTNLGSYKYGDKGIKGNEFRNGTLNVTGNQEFSPDGVYTFGSGFTVNQTANQWGISGSRTVKFIDGAKLNYTSTSDIYFGRLAGGATYNGTSQFILDGGIVNASASLYFSPKATSGNKDKNVVLNFIMLNNSSLTLPTDKELRFGEVSRDSSYKHKTLKVTAAITNSTITAKQVRIGQISSYISDTANSFNKITFGPGTVLNVGQVYSYAYPAPTVVFDGVKICWNAAAGDSIIGQNDGVKTSIYTIGPKGLVIDKQSGYSRTEVSNMASALSGTGGITKTGPGNITWNNGRIGGSTTNPMTFTGPLVVSNGTWTSTLGYAASAFRADGGRLVLSGELSAENVAFAATEAGTLTLAGATITDGSPDLELAGGGKTDYFTRDNAVGSYTLDSLTLGEGAVLDLDANATAVDAIKATTTTITATSDSPATININFSAAPSAGATFTLLNADSADKFIVVPKFANVPIPNAVSVVNGVLTLTVTADNYTWNGSQSNWGDTGAWTKNGDATTWSDGNNAVFGMANATATLTADAAASEVLFTADVTVSGSGSAALTALKVNVAEDVAATISAPTSGSLEKTGEGTLTLGASRTAQTTVSAGTLAMANGATVDGSKLTLGTDAAKPVVFDYGGQQLAFNPESNIPAHMDVALTNGEFTSSGTTYIEDSTMRVAAGASFVGPGWICVGGKTSSDTSGSISACLVVDGGAVTNSANHLCIGDYGAIGSCSKVLVTNGGEYYSANHVSVAQGSTGYLIVDASRVTAISGLRFCNEERCVEGENGYVSVTNGGEIVTKAVKYGSGAGNGYFDFDGGTLKARAAGTLISAHDRLFVRVNAEGGTIDNGGVSVTIAEDLLGAGAVTNKGAGKITYSTNQTGTGMMICEAGETFLNAGLMVARPVTVKEGAKFSVKATAQSTVSSLVLEAGSTLHFDSYAANVTPIKVTTGLVIPESGTVTLTKNGGAFIKGLYPILEKSGITATEVANLIPNTSDLQYEWMVQGDVLVLAVGMGKISGFVWTGAAGDGKMSTDGNWLDGVAPSVAGTDLDFSGVAVDATIIGDIDVTFGAVKMGDGVITFTGEKMKAASFSDTRKVAVDAGSAVTVVGDLTINAEDGDGIVNKVDVGGRFVVDGTLTITGGSIHPLLHTGLGYIVVGGIVLDDQLYSTKDETSQKWVIGSSGITGTGHIWCLSNKKNDCWIYPDDSDFDIDVNMVLRDAIDHHELNTTGYGNGSPYTITLNAGLADKGHLYIAGTGKVVVNSVPTATGGKSAYEGNVTVQDTATLAINADKKLTTGTITFAAGTALEVPSTGVEMGAIAFSGEGTVMLKVAAGDSALDAGTYTLVTSSSALPNNVLAKFSLDASLVKGDADAWLEVGGDGKSLVLNIGDRSRADAGIWIGGSGDFSTAANWKNGQVPVADGDLDFSGVTAKMTINCGDMSGTKFGAVTMGTGAITFTGSFMAASFSDTSKIAVGANSTVTLDGDLTFSGSGNYYLTYKVDEGGAFVVTGTITASESADVRPYSQSSSGYIVTKGLVNSESSEWRFRLNNDNPAKWVVGKNGFSGGSAGFWSFNNSNAETTIKADADFDIDTWLSTGTTTGKGMSIDTAGWTDPEASYTITVNNCIIGVKPLTVLGGGKFVCNYTPQKANGQNYPYSGAITVTNTATLAINPGKYPTTGAITLNEGTTLEVAQSGTVALGGALTIKSGAALAFNYTNRGNPVLNLDGKTVTFEEAPSVVVKISASADKRPFAGENVLTCGGNFSEDVDLTLAEGAPDWVKRVYVNGGNIAIDVKPIGTKITVR